MTNIDEFIQFGAVKLISEQPEFFHMVILDGFDETKTIKVWDVLEKQGVTKTYPIIAVHVTGKNFFDIILVKDIKTK